jgi:hypothetical protein
VGYGFRILLYVVEKKQILRKPLFCTWELNTYSKKQTTDSMHVSVVVGELYLGLIHISCVTSHFSSSQRVQLREM